MRWLRKITVIFFASTVLFVLLFRFVPPPITPLMGIRYCMRLASGGKPKLEKSWRPLEKISPRLAEAVIASEDQLFMEHWGFDWGAILSAFSINGKGRRKLGASTITQQTAKNLFLWPDRSWTRKALEAYFTLLLETIWNKHRIIEVYLNIVETGDGVYGAEAAAQRYFGISAAELDRNQAALIAASLPNPRAWSPANPTAYLLRRRTWILRQMDHRGPLPIEFSSVTSRVPIGPDPARPRKPAPIHGVGKNGPAKGDAADSGRLLLRSALPESAHADDADPRPSDRPAASSGDSDSTAARDSALRE